MNRYPLLTGLGLLVVACSGNSPPPSAPALPSASAAVAKPALVEQSPTATQASAVVGRVTVAIVVDQLAAWVADERLPLLPKSGGFARLMREGTWYKDVRFSHAITETAPGHASLYSGKSPHEHGIVANEVLSSGKASAFLLDQNTKVVGPEGIRADAGSSAIALIGDVAADKFRAQHPQGKVYSFSVKDRGAIFGGGRHPDVVAWFDPGSVAFVTSTAFGDKLPDWVVNLGSTTAVTARAAQTWTVQDQAWVTHSVCKDDAEGEGNLGNYKTTFPHQPNLAAKPFAAYRVNPDSDKLLLEMGLASLDHSPKDAPVFLAISLSANDYIGHIFGPDSWEAWDELQRLDASLEWFFAELDKRKGSSNWTAVLSADHGVAPLPEVSRMLAKQGNKEHPKDARPLELTDRVEAAALEKVATQAAEKALGKGTWIAKVVDPYLYFSDDAKKLEPKKRQKLSRAVTNALLKQPSVAKIFETKGSATTCPPSSDESLDALACNSILTGRGGDYFIALKSGHFFDTGYVPGAGTSHGNASLYDRSVPLFVRPAIANQAGAAVAAPQSFALFSKELERQMSDK